MPIGLKTKKIYHGTFALRDDYVDGEPYFANIETGSFAYKNQQKWMISNQLGSKTEDPDYLICRYHEKNTIKPSEYSRSIKERLVYNIPNKKLSK